MSIQKHHIRKRGKLTTGGGLLNAGVCGCCNRVAYSSRAEVERAIGTSQGEAQRVFEEREETGKDWLQGKDGLLCDDDNCDCGGVDLSIPVVVAFPHRTQLCFEPDELAQAIAEYGGVPMGFVGHDNTGTPCWAPLKKYAHHEAVNHYLARVSDARTSESVEWLDTFGFDNVA